MTKTFVCTLLQTLLSFTVEAQFEVNGKISDDKNSSVPYASVALATATDTSTVQFTIANENGIFNMKNVDTGSYYLVIASVGYDVEHQMVQIKGDIPDFNVVLTSGAASMKEVMIRAKSIPVLMNGDTIVYNSSSFKTQTNANVEDLIRKLPGVNVGSDGALTAEGEQVTKVLINGKEFFGGNVEAATKNLDASLVDNVEVIDKKRDEDEFTDDNNNETEKVINLVLKEEHAQGYFGNIRLGYGLEDIYDAHGNINFFRDATQLSIIGGSNNVNKRLYGWRDMRTLNNFEINPLNNWNSMTTWNSGISTNNGVGANLHIEPLKGIKTDFSYVVTDVQSVDTTSKFSEFYLPKSIQYRNNNGNSNGQSQNHQINGKIEFEPDTLNRIVIRAQGETQTNNKFNANQVFSFLNSPENILNSAVTSGNQAENNSKFASKIHWTKKNKRDKNRYWMSSLYYGTSERNEDGQSYFEDTDGLLLPFPTNEDPIINQLLTTEEQTVATTLGYQHKINEKWTIRPGINWMGTDYRHDFDWITTTDGIDKGNSPHGDVRSDNLEYYIHFIYKLDSFTTIRIVPELNQMIEYRDFQTDTNVAYSFNQPYFIPYIFVSSRKKHKYNLWASLRANVQRPQTSQILPITDTRNPYFTSKGNIELVNFMNYSGYMNFRKIFGLTKSLNLNSWNQYTLNPVVSKSTVDENGFAVNELINNKYRTSTTQNVNLNWPLKLLKATSEWGLQHNYSKSFTIQNEEEIEATDNLFRGSIRLQWYEFDKISFEAFYSVGYNSGTIQGVQNNGFVSQDIYAEVIWNPIERLELSVDLDLETYSGSEAAPAQTIPILGSSITYSLDTKQRWSIGLTAFDILDKNTNIWRSWGQNRFSQRQNLMIQRYFMATIRYNIKKPKSREKGRRRDY